MLLLAHADDGDTGTVMVSRLELLCLLDGMELAGSRWDTSDQVIVKLLAAQFRTCTTTANTHSVNSVILD